MSFLRKAPESCCKRWNASEFKQRMPECWLYILSVGLKFHFKHPKFFVKVPKDWRLDETSQAGEITFGPFVNDPVESMHSDIDEVSLRGNEPFSKSSVTFLFENCTTLSSTSTAPKKLEPSPTKEFNSLRLPLHGCLTLTARWMTVFKTRLSFQQKRWPPLLWIPCEEVHSGNWDSPEQYLLAQKHGSTAYQREQLIGYGIPLGHNAPFELLGAQHWQKISYHEHR